MENSLPFSHSFRLIVFLVLGSAWTLRAAPGDLDPTFSTDGKTTLDIAGGYDRANQVLVQSDGKILAAGYSHGGGDNDFVLVRYKADGTLDPTFGSNGVATTDFNSGSQDIAWAAVLQTDGKIVLAGSSDSDFALARYSSTGSLDADFGTGGLVTTDFADGGESINDLYVDGAGNFVVVGSRNDGAGTDFDIILARYTAGGVLDPSFGSGGRVITDIAGYDDQGLAVAPQPDGKIIVTGDTQPSEFGVDLIIGRFDADGTLDTDFGNNGFALTDINADWNGGKDHHILPDGKILVAGYAYDGPSSDFALVRYNADGTLDTDFGGGGVAVTDFFLGNDSAYGIAVQEDGMILLAGVAYAGTLRENFALARYGSDGELDTAFGNAGLAATDFHSNSVDSGTSIALQADGKILVAGIADSDIALARYEGTAMVVDPDPDNDEAAAIQAAAVAVRAAMIARISKKISKAKKKLKKTKRKRKFQKVKKIKSKIKRLRKQLRTV